METGTEGKGPRLTIVMPRLYADPNRPSLPIHFSSAICHLSLILFDRQVWSSAFRLHLRPGSLSSEERGRVCAPVRDPSTPNREGCEKIHVSRPWVSARPR